MSCPNFDWKAYALGELAPGDKTKADQHLAACAACREEMERYGLTVALMRRLPQHVPPRRIAFVSDPVLEPKWWQRFLASAPQLGFASAAMVAVAILVHAAVVSRQIPVASPVAVTEIERRIDGKVTEEVAKMLPAAVDARVRAEIQPAMSELGKRLDAFEKTSLVQVRRDIAGKADVTDVRAAFDMLDKRVNAQMLSAARYGGD